jgi:hypothetical protein
MNPKPFSLLNHLTLPVAMPTLICALETRMNFAAAAPPATLGAA